MSGPASIVPLRNLRTGEIVEARLLDGITEAHLEDVERTWLPEILAGLQRLMASGRTRREWPQSHHWNWRSKVEHVRGILAYRGFAVEYQEQTQGLMLVKMSEVCRLPNQRGKPLVYIDYLETAPWNQRELVDQPRIVGDKGVASLAQQKLFLPTSSALSTDFTSRRSTTAMMR